MQTEKNRRCFNWCPNGWCRWSLSKKVAKMTLSIKNLVETPIPNRMGFPVTDSGLEPLSCNFITFESRKSAFKQIMDALKDDNVNMIGLQGMGGMGKTTLVEEVQREAKKDNLFKYAVIALVSHNPNPEEIQKRIADKLQLRFTEDSTEGRADLLRWRLGNEGKVLIILDDVWKELNVEKIGIPHGQSNHGGCKILLTTHLQSVCALMRCQRTIELQILEENEAWKFFEINADLNNPPREILKVATDIVKRCKGLPIAIVTLGKALRGRSVNGWKAALQQLESYRLMDIDVAVAGDKDVFTCLMLSYTYLKVQKTKQCFLLCASFPDLEIDVEDLVRCAWGLELYRGVTVDAARTEVLAAIDELRDSSLLLASGRGGIKMHDMFRDVALFIRDRLQQASQEGSSSASATSGVGSLEWLRNEISIKPYKVVSLSGTKMEAAFHPDIQESLQALLLVNCDGMVSPSEHFGKIKELKVLTIAGGNLLSVPNVFHLAKKLRTLNLVFCGLKDFSSLSKLKKLEILIIHDTKIEQLPDEIVKLKNLRLLDLSECGCLQMIPPSLFEKLSRLEVLYLGRFKKWAKIPLKSNARLSELNSLNRLRALSLAVPPTSFPVDFVFPKLDRYEIVIHASCTSGYPTAKSLLVQEVSFLNAFKNLFPEVQYLVLDHIHGVQNLVPSLDQEGLIALVSLALNCCLSIKCLVEEVVTPQPQLLSCLSVLTTLKIDKCFELEYIFPVSVAENLPPLRVLHLICLPRLKVILGPVDEQQRNYMIKLPSLRELEVTNCPQLSAFVVSPEIQEFRMFYMGESNQLSNAITAPLGPRSQDLDFLAIGNFQNMFQFQPGTTVSKLKALLLNGLSTLQFIWNAPNQYVALQFLIELEVTDCNSLKYIFIRTLDLPQLRILTIKRCHGLEKILQNWQLQKIRAIIVAFMHENT